MNDPLPRYSPEEFNYFELLKLHASSFAAAHQNYAQAIEHLKETHDLYHENPALRSRELAYQAALLKLQSTKHLIDEIKALLYGDADKQVNDLEGRS